MTKIKYMGFTLYKKDLLSYINFAEKHPSHYRDPNRLDYHTDRVVESFIYALSENKFECNKEDKDICGIIERLVQEYGCNENGIYSEEAHAALKNVYQYYGRNPKEIQLADRQPKADWRESLSSIKKAASSVKTNIGLSFKGLWKKGKKYIVAACVVGASLLAVKPVINFFSSAKQQRVEVKENRKLVSVDSTVSWQEVAKNVAENQDKTKSDSLKKILENKSQYQSQVIVGRLSQESAKNLEKACNRAPSIVIDDLQKKGILPADYRKQTLKKYIEAHPKSHVTEVPSRILLSDIHKVYAQNPEKSLQELSDYVNCNQKRFLSAMRTFQKNQANQIQQIKNLKQLRDSKNR